MKIRDVNEFVDRYRPDGHVVALRGKFQGNRVVFQDYEPNSGSSSSDLSTRIVAAAYGYQPQQEQLAKMQEILTAQSAQLTAQRSHILKLTRDLTNSQDENARLKAQLGTQGSQAMLTDWGDTNDRFDYNGNITVPVFVPEASVETGEYANKVLLGANVETQMMKTVYPVSMVREAAMIGPTHEASWNPRKLDDSQRLAEEYMVFSLEGPQKAVRMNLKDIILNKSL